MRLMRSLEVARVRKCRKYQARSILGEGILCGTCSPASFCGTHSDNGKKLSLLAEQHLQLAQVAWQCTAVSVQRQERGSPLMRSQAA